MVSLVWTKGLLKKGCRFFDIEELSLKKWDSLLSLVSTLFPTSLSKKGVFDSSVFACRDWEVVVDLVSVVTNFGLVNLNYPLLVNGLDKNLSGFLALATILKNLGVPNMAGLCI